MMRLLVVGLLVACTHERPLSSLHELAGKEVTVETVDAVSVEVTAEQAPDGLAFRSQAGYVSADRVVTITEVRRGRGALEGLGIGALIGFAGGAVLGYADGDDECNPDDGHWCFFTFTAEEKAVFGGTLLGLMGGGIGLVVGALRGSQYVYSYGDHVRVMPSGPPGSTLGMTIEF